MSYRSKTGFFLILTKYNYDKPNKNKYYNCLKLQSNILKDNSYVILN